MSKIGLSLKIDVTKIDKSKLFKGQKGTYLDATIFFDLDNEDDYGNNGMITQSWKDQQKGEGAILGNGKIFWRDNTSAGVSQQQGGSTQGSPKAEPDFDFDEDFPL